MRKLYNTLLFFMVIFVISSFAAEETPKPNTIKTKASQMSEVIGILELHGVKLKNTFFFFDFDEVLAKTVATFNDHEFKLLPCPDKDRTYQEVFLAAFQGSSFVLKGFKLPRDRYSDVSLEERYEVLDEGTIDLVCELCEYARFVGICSGIPRDQSREELMDYVGLDKEHYFYSEQGKHQAIYDCLKEEVKESDKEVAAIVLLDNSEKSEIVPFLRDIPALAQKLDFTDLTIMGIEFTKFAEMATQEAIREELNILEGLIKK